MTGKPKKRYKTFTYQSELQWVENRSGRITDSDKPDIRVSSPPEFKGEAGVWSPEDLFVASVNICTMTTFLAFAEKRTLPLESYISHAEGKLEFVDGAYQFTEIYLRPTIVLESPDYIRQAEQTLRDAHEKCLISQSIKARVHVQPDITMEESSVRADYQ